MTSNNSSRQRKGMWQKLKEKRAIEQEHESNFKAGRIPIHERHLHRTGIRGRKRYIYYAFFYLLAIICFVNLVMLCIMLSVLRIDKSGMESLSLFKSGLVRWMFGGDLKKVVLKTGEIGAFKNKDLYIQGNQGTLKLGHVGVEDDGSFAQVGIDQTLLQAKGGVRIVSTDINKTILHIAEHEVVWDVPAKVKNLDTKYVVSHRITSDDGKDLKIRSNGNITIRGNENVFIDSLKLNAMAKERIYFSVGKKDEMSFKASNFTMKNVPSPEAPDVNTLDSYRLCFCTNIQKLFKITSKDGLLCHNAENAACSM